MGSKTKKVGAAGRFGAGYGTNVRKNLNAIEVLQRKRQKSPFCPSGYAVRIAPGIWKCEKTGKIFAGPAYHLNSKK
ncbi:MAG: 50S ribosomal protein L37ae [archaeon]|jgi:large subunit ribosomal protein L37Ae|nr:50S ribosomal protein L37ae [archaeon]